MSQLTPTTIQDFITQVQSKPGYKNDARVRKLVDQKTPRLLDLAQRDLDAEATLEEIATIMREIAAGIGVIQKKPDALPGGPMSPEQAELVEHLSTNGYNEMVDTLQNYGYSDQIPGKARVMTAINNLGPEMLARICKFGRPTLLMTPVGDLASKTGRIDGNKKYANAGGPQGQTYFGEAAGSPLWGPPPTKFKITIVDGMPEMPQLSEEVVKMDWKHRHKHLTQEYAEKGMKMITSYEYAMLASKSLRSYEKAKSHGSPNPEDEIIDKNTYTVFNSEHLTELKKVPCGVWASGLRGFAFAGDGPDFQRDRLRSRPSVQVLEI